MFLITQKQIEGMSKMDYYWFKATYDQNYSTGVTRVPENIKEFLLEEYCAFKNSAVGVVHFRVNISYFPSETQFSLLLNLN